MTVASDVQDVTHVTDGSTVAFPIPFYFLRDTDIRADLIDGSGAVTSLVLGSDFSLVGAGNPAGGGLTTLAVFASGYLLHIYRDVPATQETQYQQNDAFPAKTTEKALDKLTMLIQRAFGLIATGIRYPFSEFGMNAVLPRAAARARKALVFKPTGEVGISQQDWKEPQTILDEAKATAEAIAAGIAPGAGTGTFIQNGAGAVVRTFQNKMREIWSVADFGATSGSDVGIALQRAHDAGEGKVLVNFGQYTWDTPVTLTNALKIVGEGYTEGANAAAGTWFEVRQQNFTPLTFSGGNARGGGIDGVAFWETNHPSGAAGWTPANNDYLIKVLNCEGGVEIGDVFMARANRGIYCYNSGRLHVRKLRGQFFTAGIEIDRCLDIPAIDYVHSWPFFTSDSNIMAYQQANLDVITTRRCDGVFLGNIFTLGSRSSIHMSSSSYGYTTKLYCDALYADLGLYGLWVDSGASHSTGQIANFTGQGERWGAGVGIDNGAAIRIDSNDCVFQIGALHTQAYWNSSIVLNGLNNEIDFANLWFESDNQSNTNSPHIFMANGAGTNRINVSGYIRSDGVNNPPMVNGSTNGNLGVAVYANRPAAATDEPRLYWGAGGATVAAIGPNAKSNLTLQGSGDGILIGGNPLQLPRFNVADLTPTLAAKYDACLVMVGDQNNRLAVSISSAWVWMDGTPVS